MFAVCVHFRLTQGAIRDFLPLMRRQAGNSLMLEADCHVFDICVDTAEDAVFLYELYSDAAAFQRHLESAHFRAFDAEIAGMVATKTVKTYPEVIRS